MNPISHEFDVIICGGGPGGSTAALTFHNTDLKVAVIEKSNFPREKVCGDGLLAYVPKALNKISPQFADAFEKISEKAFVRDIHVTSFNGNSASIRFPEKCYTIPRYYFDNFLYQQAKALPNVTYFLEQQIKSVQIEDDKCTVITDKNEIFHSKIILGCDGATSLVRRQLTDYIKDPAFIIVSVRAYYENLKDIKLNTYELHFSPKYPEGYLWIFPTFNNQVNVGFGTFSDLMSKNKIILKDAILEIINESPSLKERFKDAKIVDDYKGWSIPLGYGKHPISGNRFMLCGDAACITDPATGEGIGPAMVSGRIAAYQAINCFKKEDFSKQFMKEYDKQMHIKFGKSYLRQKKMADIFLKNKWIFNSIIKIINSSSFLSKNIMKIYSTIFP